MTRHLTRRAQVGECGGDLFKRGVLLYTGEQVVQFDEQLAAIPMGFLWCA